MASLNKVLIMGNLGADPDLAYTPGGQAVAHFNVATNEVWTDRDGNRQERTEWHRVTVWGKQAEHCKEYLRKGRTVFVEGRLRTRQWEDRQGQRRYTTEIVAQSVQFMGGPGPARVQADDNGSSLVEPPVTDTAEPPAIEDDQVPF